MGAQCNFSHGVCGSDSMIQTNPKRRWRVLVTNAEGEKKLVQLAGSNFWPWHVWKHALPGQREYLSDPIWCFIMDLSPVSLSIWPFWRVYTIVRQTQSRRSMKLNWPISGVLGLLFCLPLKLDTWKTDRPLWLNASFWRKAVGILSVGWR